MSDQESHDQQSHDHDSHGGSATYIAVFLALCVLTGASFFTYSSYWPFQDTPSVGWAFMMAVSCTKALLVILFFMHLIHEANWKYVLTFPAMFMSVFLLLMLIPDIGWRDHHVSRERQLHMALPRSATVTAHDEHEQDHHEQQPDEHGSAPAEQHP